MNHDYQMQYPDMRISVYTPRTVRASSLGKVKNIEVDTTCLCTQHEGAEVFYWPISSHQIACAVWLSALIGGHFTSSRFQAPKESLYFLGRTEQLFAESCELELPANAQISTVVGWLNKKAKAYGWWFHLQKVSIWENVLLSLMESQPVMMGGTVYESFDRALVSASGIVPMPAPGEDLLGGQIITLLGFDQSTDLGTATVANQGVFTYRGSHLRNLGIFRDFFVLVPRYGDAN